MKLIGLCGNSGSGKSELCRVLTRRGVTCIDCDALTRAVQGKDSPCVNELVRAFGRGILLPSRELDRGKTARIAFSDPEKTKTLNAITHKYILEALRKELEKHRDKPFVVIDAPTLFESGLDQSCDYVVGLVSEKNAERLKARDRLDDEGIKTRLMRQHDDAFYRAHCDLVLENNADMGALDALADQLIRAIQTEV